MSKKQPDSNGRGSSGDRDSPPPFTRKMAERGRHMIGDIVVRKALPRKSDVERKEPISLRLTPRVLSYFRAGGAGWQTRIDRELQAVVDREQDVWRRSGQAPSAAEPDDVAVDPSATAEAVVNDLFNLQRNRFRQLERSEGLTQQELATRVGVSRSRISRLLAKPSNITVSTAAKILMAMGRRLELGASDPLDVRNGAPSSPGENSNVVHLSSIRMSPRPAQPEPLADEQMRLVAASKRYEGQLRPPAEQTKIFRLLNPVSAAGGVGVFNDVGDRVQFVVIGVKLPTRLKLGEIDVPLTPSPLSPNVFYLPSAITRVDVVDILIKHEQSPNDGVIDWQ